MNYDIVKKIEETGTTVIEVNLCEPSNKKFWKNYTQDHSYVVVN